ncbi:hypothetical protein [Microbacterium sp. SORGH_AS_0888]|uniref:hypothetical protein n=1 Tax=Microbacterium sp. SORGH_AS_0888 TaxID=3041791 RepID=UPI0027D7BA67|nr:hypothetical protein [Microbacterium sp. SORGH_AS_0888]
MSIAKIMLLRMERRERADDNVFPYINSARTADMCEIPQAASLAQRETLADPAEMACSRNCAVTADFCSRAQRHAALSSSIDVRTFTNGAKLPELDLSLTAQLYAAIDEYEIPSSENSTN